MLTVALLVYDAVQSDTSELRFQRKFLHPSSEYYRLPNSGPYPEGQKSNVPHAPFV